MTSMTETIRAKLAQSLQPSRLEIVNESAKHAGHAGDDGSGESHFRVLVVSKAFEGMGRVERQRTVYEALQQEMTVIHALSIKALTKNEYDRV